MCVAALKVSHMCLCVFMRLRVYPLSLHSTDTQHPLLPPKSCASSTFDFYLHSPADTESSGNFPVTLTCSFTFHLFIVHLTTHTIATEKLQWHFRKFPFCAGAFCLMCFCQSQLICAFRYVVVSFA